MRHNRFRGMMLLAVVAVLAGWTVGPGAAADPAQQGVQANLWVPNGNVRASAVVGNTLYLGGDFDYVGPPTGHGVPLDRSSGTAAANFPAANGNVASVVGDGAGGWFIGGTFTSVGGVPRAGLAHVTSDNRVDPAFAPTPNGGVRAVALAGGMLYVGGDFTALSGVARGGLAAVDAVTAAVAAFNPAPDRPVSRLTVAGGLLYAAGFFATMAGQPRHGVAAFDTATSRLTPWTAGVLGLEAVNGIAAANGLVYLGALIRTGAGSFEGALAAVNASSGGLVWTFATRTAPSAIALAGNRLIAAANFATSAPEFPIPSLAAFDPATGTRLAWDVIQPDQGATELAVIGDTVYVGGTFTHVGSTQRLRLAAYDIRTGALLPWNPSAGGWVSTLSVQGTSVFAGGRFASVNGLTRAFFAALDLTTGRPTAFDANTNGSITTITPVGSTIFVTGGFNQFLGAPRTTAAAFSVTTGRITPFSTRLFNLGSIYAATTDGTVLYVGGSFTNFITDSGAFIQRLYTAAFNLNTGQLTNWQPRPDNEVRAMLFANNQIYLGGFFDTVAGQPRHSLASVSRQARVSGWNPARDSDVINVEAFSLSGSALYLAGDFLELAGVPREAFAAVDASSGAVLPFHPAGSFNTSGTAITVDGGVAYAGFLGPPSLGGAPRVGLAGLNPQTGAVTPFRADLAFTDLIGGGVNTIGVNAISPVSGGSVYVAGGFDGIAGTSHANLAGLTR